jgi:PAS domain S-box-containing protein
MNRFRSLAANAAAHDGPPQRDRPLASHLATLCLALVLPILLLAAVLTWFYADSERRRIEQEALTAAHDVIAESDRMLSGLIATTEVLSVSRWLELGDLDGFDAQARAVYQRLGINIVLRNRQSQQVVNTRVPRGTPLPTNLDPETDRAVLEAKRPVVSNLFIGGVMRKPLFMVNVPVFRGGEINYFLNLSLEPERIRDLILATDPPSGAAVAMADRRGVVIAHSARHDAAVGRPLSKTIWDEIKGHEGILGQRVMDPSEGSVLVAFSRSDLSGWTAVVMLPSALASAPLRHSLAGLATLAAVTLALAGVLALVFSRRIEQPVGALTREAARLGLGETVRAPATPVREVNMLGAVLSKAATKRQAAEAALRDSEERYRALSSATREGVVIHSQWRIIEANEAFWAMFGHASRGEVVGLRPLRFIAQEARNGVLANVRHQVAEPYESLAQRPDGSVFPIELCTRSITYQGCPVWVTVVRDLTAQKAAEAALREGEARLRLAQTAGRIGTWEWDPVKGVATCSEAYCRLYGLDPKGPGHRSPEAWLAQVHPDDRERVRWMKGPTIASGRLENEYRIVRPDGSVRWIIDRGLAIYDPDGRFIRLLGATVDITEMRLAQERLRALQSQVLHASRLSAMGQMAAALAHELNQPLGAAANFLNAARIALGSGSPDAQERAMARLERAAAQTVRAGAILRRLRDFVGRGEADKRVVNVRRLVEDAVALAVVGNRDPELRTTFDFDPRDPSILADSIQIQQVVFNLVRNALEAMEAGPHRQILVTVKITGEAEVEISVADTGSGLPSDPEVLFRPFATTKASGLGIGLSICRTIVEAHGGRLWAEPRPGGGAVFRFTVPAMQAREAVDVERTHHPCGG